LSTHFLTLRTKHSPQQPTFFSITLNLRLFKYLLESYSHKEKTMYPFRFFRPENFLYKVIRTVSDLARLQVLTAASMKTTVFWVVAPFTVVKVYRRFRGASCLHH
jgi:hypothetical protein